jgi:cobalt-zinc-cadmium efflux system membrane fusion protein
VPNSGGRLKPEMFVAVELTVGGAAPADSVPADAVFTEDERTFVYVEVGAGRFTRRAVTVAPGGGSMRRILDGLQHGDRVVVVGALLLRQEEQQRAS